TAGSGALASARTFFMNRYTPAAAATANRIVTTAANAPRFTSTTSWFSFAQTDRVQTEVRSTSGRDAGVAVALPGHDQTERAPHVRPGGDRARALCESRRIRG